MGIKSSAFCIHVMITMSLSYVLHHCITVERKKKSYPSLRSAFSTPRYFKASATAKTPRLGHLYFGKMLQPQRHELHTTPHNLDNLNVELRKQTFNPIMSTSNFRCTNIAITFGRLDFWNESRTLKKGKRLNCKQVVIDFGRHIRYYFLKWITPIHSTGFFFTLQRLN